MTVPFLAAPALADPRLRHGFFTRAGGVSDGPFASLNCSLSGKDELARVLENRARAVAAFGLPPAALVGLFQIHSPTVAVVERPWGVDGRPQADASVTRLRGVALGIVTADCAPVLLADAEAGVIGAVHAGWRGAVAGVLEATVAVMVKLGARASAIAAAIGPCIRQPSYEVGPDLCAALLAADAAHARFLAPGRRAERWQFDLAGFCADRLAAAGVATVETVPADTLADAARFFSYRRTTLEGGGPLGHQLSAIALAP
ncbi:MAG: peptidoglycan editing factor PgeF [Alphaproteobacteria bacterium]|nr:peptidoglycan editing factor PgeF [Alphaproteobacteria bacterium]